MKRACCSWMALATLLVGTTALAAETLVQKKDGKVSAGLAKSWKQSGEAVLFSLEAGVDGARAAKAINDGVAGAKASFAKGELEVSGLPLDTLLDQLSRLSLAADGDPLADISGLGGTMLAMETPEAGGSIRASKPTSADGAFAPHEPASRFVGEVVTVKRGSFPTVTLKLKVAQVGAKHDAKLAAKGKTFEAPVVFAGAGAIDMRDPNNLRNIGAYYLAPGDKVSVHAVATGAGKVEIDFVERHSK